MADSSGTATYACTRDDMILSAFRLLRVTREGDVPNSNQTAYAVTALQMLLKNLQSEGLVLWTFEQLQVPIVSQQDAYTIGPVGADVTAVRPLRLMDGSFVRFTAGPKPIDTNLEIFNRQKYLQITEKEDTGSATGIYYFPGIDQGSSTNPGTGFGTLYLFMPSSVSAGTLFLNVQRPIYDMSSESDSFDLPQEWFRALKYMLAADMGPEYTDDFNRVMFLQKMGENLRSRLTQWNYDQAAVAFGEDNVRQERARDQNKAEG